VRSILNKKALPIVIAVAVVAIIILIFSITKSTNSGTDKPMPTKPRLADEARQHIMMRGRPGFGTPSGAPGSPQ
jgi:hypothetical protein